ncbi:hypothetical protein MRB53_040531 [Persea americana]|nr:hypothetical protein MRB53_040531 [Persea americana]
MEQGLLNVAFAPDDNAFGTNYLDLTWNPHDAFIEDPETMSQARVIHQKLWVPMIVSGNPSLRHMWDVSWMELCRFYDSEIFQDARDSGVMKSALQLYAEALNRGKEKEQ